MSKDEPVGLSYNEKESIISIITSVIVSIPYLAYILNKFYSEEMSSEESLKFWASAILLLIPIRIISEIIVHIIFAVFSAAISGNEEKDISDERDEIISLRAQRHEYYFFVIGFMAALISAATGSDITTFFLILFVTGFITEIIENASKLLQYRLG